MDVWAIHLSLLHLHTVNYLLGRHSAVVVLQHRTSAHGLRLSRLQVRANRERCEACNHPTRHRLLVHRRLGLQQK